MARRRARWRVRDRRGRFVRARRNGRRRRRNPILQIVGAPDKFFRKNPRPRVKGSGRYWSPRLYVKSLGRPRKPRLRRALTRIGSKRLAGLSRLPLWPKRKNPHPKRSKGLTLKKRRIGTYLRYGDPTGEFRPVRGERWWFKGTKHGALKGRKSRRNPGELLSAVARGVGSAVGGYAAGKLLERNPHPKQSKAWRGKGTGRSQDDPARADVSPFLPWRAADASMLARRGGKTKFRLRPGYSLKRNPGRAGQRVLSAKIVPFGEAARLVGSRDAAIAAAGYRGFHGREPLHAIRVRIDDGSSRLTRRAVFEVGNAPSLEYVTRDHSEKARDRGGKRILWRHKMGELGGRKPTIVHDPKSGVTSFVGGTYRIGRAEGGDEKTWYLH